MPFRRLSSLHTWLWRLLLISVAAAVGVAALGIYSGGLTWGRLAHSLGALTGLPGLPQWQVAIIAGHRNFDTGAVCDTGLMEVAVTSEVAERLAKRLERQGVDVQVLDEYDPKLQSLQADALVSIHADSCVSLSGFKVASAEQTALPDQDALLVKCLEESYAGATGLSTHPNTITHDMTGYHAFQRVAETTPGAIIELGFLGGDGALLAEERPKLARGIAEGVMCFLKQRQSSQSPDLATPTTPLPDPTPTPAP